MGAGNLDELQAKTLIYYCIMTWSDAPIIRPIIDLNGESGTGKNGIMKQIKDWCCKPKWINARNITSAQLRDELADVHTAFIEEADKTKSSKESENWYQFRYDETGGEISYRKQMVNIKSNSIVIEETHSHFGYTILHTQNPFESPEMDRRILRLTIFKDMGRQYKFTTISGTTILVTYASEIDWDMEIEGALSNSAWDVWLPLMRVAAYLADEEFMEFARGQIRIKTEEDELTKVFEPKGVVLGEIATMYEACLHGPSSHIEITEIRKQVTERGYMHNEKQIVKLARELGFTIVYPHNKAHIKVISRDQLEQIFIRAGVGQNLEDTSDMGEIVGSVV